MIRVDLFFAEKKPRCYAIEISYNILCMLSVFVDVVERYQNVLDQRKLLCGLYALSFTSKNI